MSRKDLRNAESEWRATKQTKRPLEIPGKRFKVLTAIKILAVIALLVLLWETNPMRSAHCQSTGGNSLQCVD